MERRSSGSSRQDLRIIFVEVLAWSVMVGVGESYLAAFALALGIGEATVGVLTTLPVLVGSLLQTVSPRAILRLGSYRRWVVGCVAVQAGIFLPLAGGALVGALSVPALFVLLSGYWASALAAAPAWNAWVGGLIPRRVRAKFFALRSRASQVAIGVSLLVSGAFLDLASRSGHRLLAFAILFLLAAAARALSAWMMSRQSEFPGRVEADRHVSFRNLFDPRRPGRDGRLVVYMLGVIFTTHLSAPFFAPYLLEQVRLDYLAWVGVLAIPYMTRILALPVLGEIARRRGTTRLLWMGAVAVVPLPWMWTLSSSLPWLLTVAAWSGWSWAAYELGTFLLFFEDISPSERTSVLTSFYLLRAIAMSLGALVGAWALARLGTDRAAYHLLFQVGSLARISALVLLFRLGKDVAGQRNYKLVQGGCGPRRALRSRVRRGGGGSGSGSPSGAPGGR